jgi:predicted AlkP superfamily phosphohydrolase/phosphomutase
MEKSLDVRIQYFAGLLSGKITELEGTLLSGLATPGEEKRSMIASEIYEDLLDQFEGVFSDVLYSDDDDDINFN